MPIRYSVDADRGRLHVVVDGEFTTEEMISTVRAFIAEPALPHGFTALSDHTRVQRPLTSSQLLALVAVMEEHRERFAGVRWAMVSTRPASYGMMRVLAARAQLFLDMRVRIFFDSRRAAEWLDRPRADGVED